MKWYRFWKKVQGYNAGEDYREFKDDATEKFIKEECEYWAESVPGGSNVGYRYGFEVIEKPPKEYIIKEIDSIRRSIAGLQKQLEDYKFTLKTYSVKAKIDKIKNNIK